MVRVEVRVIKVFGRAIESNMSQSLDNDRYTYVVQYSGRVMQRGVTFGCVSRENDIFVCSTASAAACAAPRAARGFANGAPIPTSRASRR